MRHPKSPLSSALRSTYPAMAAGFALSFFINVSLLVSPLYSLQIYDRVLSSRNATTLILLTAIVLAFLVLYGLLEYARSGILVRGGTMFESRLRKPLFDSMVRAELDPAARQGQQVIRDAESIRDLISSGTVATLFDLPWTPIFILLCFALHPVLGLLALGGAVLLFGLALLAETLGRRQHERTSRLASEASVFAATVLRNGEAVRGLGMGDIVLERWCGHQAAAVSALATAQERTAALVALSKFARVTVQTAALCVGAWLAIDGAISPGVIMAATILMGRALAPVEQIVGQWKRIVAARSASQRLESLFRAAPPQPAKMALPTPVGTIDVENILVAPLGSGRPSVRNLSFRLEAGESLAVVGASASGKSSLCRALAGVWPLSGGAIRIDGAALNQWNPDDLGKHVGYLPQDVELFSGTIADNIARLQEVDEAKVLEAAKMAGIHQMILRLPAGYDTAIGDGGVTLSGGMRQRVGLARALYGDPRLILLDEPNSNLDEDGDRALAEALAKVRATRRTLIIVTHRPQILQHVDKLLVMSLGSAVAFGPRDEVIARMRGNRVAAVEQRAR